jgi:hypothetical protein
LNTFPWLAVLSLAPMPAQCCFGLAPACDPMIFRTRVSGVCKAQWSTFTSLKFGKMTSADGDEEHVKKGLVKYMWVVTIVQLHQCFILVTRHHIILIKKEHVISGRHYIYPASAPGRS